MRTRPLAPTRDPAASRSTSAEGFFVHIPADAMSSTQSLGERGEALAARYLEDQGYRVLDRNYRFERNEVDLVCFEPNEDDTGGELVFVEVKARSSLGFGAPEEAVDDKKQEALVEVSRAWMHERRMEGAAARFDVVAVVLQQGRAPNITHHENAFWPS